MITKLKELFAKRKARKLKRVVNAYAKLGCAVVNTYADAANGLIDHAVSNAEAQQSIMDFIEAGQVVAKHFGPMMHEFVAIELKTEFEEFATAIEDL